MGILDLLEDYHGTVYRMSDSRFALTFWFALPEREGAGELKTVFFADPADCNRFAAEQARDNFKPTVYNLGKPQYHEQFNYSQYGVVSNNLREALKHRLMYPTKSILKGRILTQGEIDTRIKAGLPVSIHSRHEDDRTVMFVTDNCLFGYTVLPPSFSASSFSSPYRVEPREGVEHGYVTNVEQFLKVFGQQKKILWDIDGLLDELNIPEE